MITNVTTNANYNNSINNSPISFQAKYGKNVRTLKDVRKNSLRLLKEKQIINKEIKATNKELSDTIRKSLNGQISDKESFDMVVKLSMRLQELNCKK